MQNDPGVSLGRSWVKSAELIGDQVTEPPLSGPAEPLPTRRSLRESQPQPTATPSDEPSPRMIFVAPPPRRRRRIGWVVLIVVMLLVGGAVAASWGPVSSLIAKVQGPADYQGDGTGEVDFVVNSGDTGEIIARNLHSAGVTASFEAFYKLVLKQPDGTAKFVPGVFKLKQKMSVAAALAALTDPKNILQGTVLVVEGYTQAQVFAQLESVLGFHADDLAALAADPQQFGLPSQAKSLEGFLFPATYNFGPQTTPKQAIQAMVDRCMQALTQAGVAEADRWNTIVFASLVQREAALKDDFPKVARVFLNRLNPQLWPSGLLQSDATVTYCSGSTDRAQTTDAERNDASCPLNTYVHPGMLAAPISNPGDLAIDAVLHPASGDWLYFVTVNLETGETVYSNTAAEHEAAVAQWLAWMAANPSYQ